MGQRLPFPELLAAVAVVALAVTDMVADRGEGADWLHLLAEGAIALLAAAGILALGVRLRALLSVRRELTSALRSSREEGEWWRRQAEGHLAGLAAAIEAQFARWELTEAEAAVALLILKGRGHKQIAAVRGTSERTVRQQAHAVYRKAGLADRADLAAFFLGPL